MSKVVDKKMKKQTDLMRSAYDLFTSRGFGKTTIMEIANHAGVAKGTFYLYFKDKFDIRDAVIRRTAGQLLQEACESLDEQIASGNDDLQVADIFIYIIDYLVEAVSSDPLLVRFIAKHLSWGLFADNGTINLHESSTSVTFEEFIKSKLDKYNVKVRDLGLLLFTLLELVSSTCHDVILYKQPLPLEEYKPYLNNCIRLLVNNAIS